MNISVLHLLALIVGVLLPFCGGSRILVIVALGSKSHTSMFTPLMKALAAKGHEIVSLTIHKLDKPVPGITEYLVSEMEEYLEKYAKETYESENNQDTISVMRQQYLHLMVPLCEKVLKNKNVLNMLNSDDNFDLILIDASFNECLYGFIHKFKAPYIAFGLPGAFTWNSDAVGNSQNYAYIPNVLLTYSDRMTFMERATNLVESVHLDLVRNYYYLPKLDTLVRQYFGDDMPSLLEIERNASMLFVNFHFSMSPPRPNLPAAVEVGAMQCRPALPLAKEYEDFISEAGDAGFIYFSMGTALPASYMPEDKMKMFQRTFSKLKQRVIWKWEKDMPDSPANVLARKWLSQQDFLGHPKIRLFISHGGLFGTQEATYHGVPMIIIPIMGDQFLNAKKIEAAGYARPLNFFTLTEETFLEAIEDLLNNSTYKENALQKSILLRDQSETPLERAVFWTEYVLRHRGARHMRSAVLDLTWYQRAMWDIFAAFLLAASVTLFILCRTFMYIVKKLKMDKRKQE